MSDDAPVEYDMSFSTNSRINYLLWICNDSMVKQNPGLWFSACKNLLKETCVSMSTEPKKNEVMSEFEIHEGYRKKCQEAHDKFNRYMFNYQKNQGHLVFEPPQEIFELLYQWEMLLRKKLDKMGLLFRRTDDAGSAML